MTRVLRWVALPVLLFLVLVPGASAWTWPVQGTVVQGFSYDEAHPYAGGQHRGVDIAADATGEAVLAPAAGTISFAGSVPTSGRTVTIATADGYSVTLTHLGSALVHKGATVAEGDVVGAVGPSGTAEVDGPYVHLGIRLTSDSEAYLDPLTLLPALAPILPASGDASAPPTTGDADDSGDAPAPTPTDGTGTQDGQTPPVTGDPADDGQDSADTGEGEAPAAGDDGSADEQPPASDEPTQPVDAAPGQTGGPPAPPSLASSGGAAADVTAATSAPPVGDSQPVPAAATLSIAAPEWTASAPTEEPEATPSPHMQRSTTEPSVAAKTRTRTHSGSETSAPAEESTSQVSRVRQPVRARDFAPTKRPLVRQPSRPRTRPHPTSPLLSLALGLGAGIAVLVAAAFAMLRLPRRRTKPPRAAGVVVDLRSRDARRHERRAA